MLLPLCLSIALAVAAPLRAELQEAASATLAQSDAAVDLLDGAGFACVDSRRGQRARMRATAPLSPALRPLARTRALALRHPPPATCSAAKEPPSKFVFVSLSGFTGCPWRVSETYDASDEAPGAPPKVPEKVYAESPWTQGDLGRKNMPLFFTQDFCKKLAAHPPALKTRVAAMTESWVRQLEWARSQIPAETLADANVVKVVAYPEWQFRAVPGTQPLGQADVAKIRKRIQAELAKLGANKLPVYANFLVVAGSFYYGGMVNRDYKEPVARVEDKARCAAQEPYRFNDDGTLQYYTGRRPWVEKSAKGTFNRAWAMFNCVDTYFIPADGANKVSAHLVGPIIRCKQKQSEVARQVHPFREVWGRCAVVDAANQGSDLIDVFSVAAKKRHVKALGKYTDAEEKLWDKIRAASPGLAMDFDPARLTLTQPARLTPN
jgi:hypothetical protein